MILPLQTPIASLRIADTCFYYLEDPGFSESLQLGEIMMRHLDQKAPDARRLGSER